MLMTFLKLQQVLAERAFECDPNIEITSKSKREIETATLAYLHMRTTRRVMKTKINPSYNNHVQL